MRLGGLSVGLLLGAIFGALIGVVLYFTGSQSLAPWVAVAATLVGATAGLAWPQSAFSLAESALHFFIGLVGGYALQNPEPSPLAPRWLKAILAVGVFLGAIAFLAFTW